MKEVPSCASTNSLLAEMAESPEGTVVYTERQTAGRGRQGRTWISDSSLTFSLLLRPPATALVQTLPIVVGIAIAEAVKGLRGDALGVSLKWPNDVLLFGGKLAGILCEMHDGAVVVGIGLNVNSAPSIPDMKTAALTDGTGGKFERRDVLNVVLAQIGERYGQWLEDGFTPFIGRFNAMDALRGRRLMIVNYGEPTEGVADGVNEDGSLRLATANGIESIYSGEAHILTQHLAP